MLSKLFENEEYLADLRSNMPARAVAKKWGLGSKTTVTRHRAKLSRVDGVVGGAYRNPATGSYTIPIERDAVTMKPVKKHGKKGDVVDGGRIVGHKESSTGEAEYTVSHSKQLTLADADEWVRQAGKDPADYNLSVYTTAYGDGLWSNRITASPKVRKNVADFDIPKLTREEVDAIFANHKGSFSKPLSTHTSLFLLADAQLGKTNGKMGTKDTLELIMSAAYKFVEHIKETKPKAVAIVDVGDSVEGIFNVQNKQLSTNDLDLVDQVTAYRRLVLELVALFAPHTRDVVFISVPSNHGEVRVARGAAVGSVHNDWGIEINRQVEDALALSPLADKVSCIVPEPDDITVYLNMSNTGVAFTHGDKAGSGNTVGKWVLGQVAGEQPGHEAHIWVVGHYHNMYVLQIGNQKWLIGCPSPDGGSDYFTHRTGEVAKRGVLMFDVLDGMWHNLRIL